MIVHSSTKKVVYIPLVPFLCVFFGVYFYVGIIISNPEVSSTLFAARIVISLIIALALSLPLFVVLTQEGKDLIIRKLLSKKTIDIPSSRFCVRRRILCIEDRSKNLIISLMPYPYERMGKVVRTLNDKFGIESISENDFKSSEQNIRKQDIFVGVWTISGCLVALIVVYLLLGDGQLREYLNFGWVKDITVGVWQAWRGQM